MYCTSQVVTAPIELYDTVHAAVKAEVGDRDIGLLVHLTTQTPDGFTVIEVWRSKAEYDRAMTEILLPIVRGIAGAHGAPAAPPATAFDARGLIIPSSAVFV